MRGQPHCLWPNSNERVIDVMRLVIIDSNAFDWMRGPLLSIHS